MKFTLHKGEFFSQITNGETVVGTVRAECANLLGAAPEMLDALVTISDFLEANGYPGAVTETRAIICKARGEG